MTFRRYWLTTRPTLRVEGQSHGLRVYTHDIRLRFAMDFCSTNSAPSLVVHRSRVVEDRGVDTVGLVGKPEVNRQCLESYSRSRVTVC